MVRHTPRTLIGPLTRIESFWSSTPTTRCPCMARLRPPPPSSRGPRDSLRTASAAALAPALAPRPESHVVGERRRKWRREVPMYPRLRTIATPYPCVRARFSAPAPTNTAKYPETGIRTRGARCWHTFLSCVRALSVCTSPSFFPPSTGSLYPPFRASGILPFPSLPLLTTTYAAASID
ncbi:hypothetical protein B0H11DRAFT_2019387 [Mycena galericulata]|nr:hypothetical protein B0H11DRAFT_2019387 [Mycena galericulata]